MASFSLFQLFMVSALVVAGQKVRYDGYHLLRSVPRNKFHIEQLAMLKNDPKVDFWIEPTTPGQSVDIFASPETVPSIKEKLTELGLEIEVINNNAQLILDDCEGRTVGNGTSSSSFDWNDYYRIDSIYAWLKEQAQTYNQIAKVVSAGKSAEGRDLLGLRIAHKPDQPIVIVEAGVHAREWIAPAAATWFIQNILNTTSDLIKSYEWHVFPSVNPDGYEFSHTTDRLWRKTRRELTPTCFGVDGNRNFPYQWQRSANCSTTYPGTDPASEPETQGLVSYISSVASRTRVYIMLHSYSQRFLYPWSSTQTPPENHGRFAEIAKKAVEKLASRYGTDYVYGTYYSTLYPSLGTSIDYVYSLNISYPFMFELRDRGDFGFCLPKEQIIPTSLETFDAVTVILEEAKK